MEFLGEQSGEAERDLKSVLVVALRRFPNLARAYLAQVGYSPRARSSVALCIYPAEAQSRDVVDEVQRAFSLMFAKGVDLDILFLTSAEEEDLRRVCAPFFNADSKGVGTA